ncbi:hypothetical protein [Phytohabitans aurantiacus]|jgi:hypothetical protein|uniref:DUF2188 domain-containing protein n=1 Tax=Phytohabitans aurantiacus TaxID=3016789 RepID=A0ABQ5QQS8_9ACTN|nr:hypothetical protein [Phytohabitans aurantiacus]GLH96226.1 hypothetical protein Pa4123_15000 [Phytohabitans aurantiacus]
MYVYRWSDGLEVGHVDTDGVWHVEGNCTSPREAQQRVHELNRADRVAGQVTGTTEIVIEPSDDGFYTLGSYGPDGRWHPIFDVLVPEEGEPWRRWLAGDETRDPSA